MYTTFKAIITIIWVLDIINVPQAEFLDTTLPINFLGWLLILLFMPTANATITHKLKVQE